MIGLTKQELLALDLTSLHGIETEFIKASPDNFRFYCYTVDGRARPDTLPTNCEYMDTEYIAVHGSTEIVPKWTKEKDHPRYWLGIVRRWPIDAMTIPSLEES